MSDIITDPTLSMVTEPVILDRTGRRIAEALEGKRSRVQSLDSTDIVEDVIEAAGIPVYVSEAMLANYAAFGITVTGWYVFARITPKDSTTVTAETTVTGADGYIAEVGADHIDVAARFEVAAASKKVTIDWGSYAEAFVFKATDLAVRNLDYRVTFYVYDIAPFATWEYALTTDTEFVADKAYYTKDENDEYTLAEVTAGEEVTADTYYTHSKVTFEGMTRNVTYVCNTPIDCPVVFNLPVIEDETHGAWFEIRFRHTGSFSSTLVVPEGVKVATEHTQPETAGINMVDLLYSSIDDAQVWRFQNTHSTIPA